MKIAVDEVLRGLSECGCCEGTSGETPVEINNRPGLSAVAYRVGTHARIMESMLAALSDARRPSLGKLKTRDTEDFSIALLDAWATVEDVLTFYQERIANESYLRTATERLSVIELVRALGYELQPGVAASTALAFTLETAAGAPPLVTIPSGTKAQSVPGPDEKPQTFETVEELEARAAWNLLKPLKVVPQRIRSTDTHLYFKGVATNLKAGDALVFVGPNRQSSQTSTQWELRRLMSVETNPEAGWTLVRWNTALSNVMDSDNLSIWGMKVYVLRQRASVFGYNAPDWRTMTTQIQGKYLGTATDNGEWPNFNVRSPGTTDQIDLDAVYQKIVVNSWLVLTLPGGAPELYLVKNVAEAGRSDFALSGKTTRVTLDGNNLSSFDDPKPLPTPAPFPKVRTVQVFAESEELALAEVPITEPIRGKSIPLAGEVLGLEPGRKLIVAGKRLRIRLTGSRSYRLERINDARPQISGDLFVAGPPVKLSDDTLKWRLQDEDGIEFYITAAPGLFAFVREAVPAPSDKILLLPSEAADATTSETVTLDWSEPGDFENTILYLTNDLKNVYDRATVEIYANVAAATHGETTGEVLGSGDASRPFQEFTLRQQPLTYTTADTPSGAASTLEVWVNDLLWSEVPSLYGRGPKERVYMTELDDEGATTVRFGDGVTGARLPTGTANVRANYRKGIGLEGNVRANQLTLLMTRPLGVKGVTNPFAASGAADAQETEDAQQNAPLTVLTLDRIVSLRDYEDFARSYAGIAKALATWTWNVHARGVLVTVAGTGGATVSESSPLYTNLLSAMRKAGDSDVPLQVRSYVPKTFRLAAEVKVREDADPLIVRTEIEAALRLEFAFAARGFGQPVTLSEVIAVIQNIAGVVSVNVTRLYRVGESSGLATVLVARVPRAGADTNATPAELLTLDAAPLDRLEVRK